ncbi:Rne/Rng family ribonuclease [Modestobacter altitudinis]|uniref:Rne/Rng family ribonuclease n=1 Tax=Modestobacter altitudinis TaxID=2213158 RepID=UPI001FE381B0|nr:Rne/Rng family ribonuclease [Modestobacter altitudinis]
MADRIDPDTTADTTATAGSPDEAPAPADRPDGSPAVEPAAGDPAAEPLTDAADEDEEADSEAEASAAAALLPVSAPEPEPALEPESEPDLPRFGAQFSSPEPTTVTARPRRRATRPALSADPDSVPPPPAAPPVPAFVTFVAPEPDAAPTRRRSRRPAESPAEPEESAQPAAEVDDREAEPARPRGRGRNRRRAAEEAVAEPVEVEDTDDVPDVEVEADAEVEDRDLDDADDRDEEDGGGSGSRRRRRGRRGRGRGRTEDSGDAENDADEDTEAPVVDTADPDEESDDPSDAEGDDSDDETDDDSAEAGQGSSTRRRRRRRRRGSSGEGTVEDTSDDDDRPERAGRNGRTSSDDDVRGVAGSTRLEAKRQRRREGRDGGRKRAPILSESEFLARREAVDRAMVIRQQGERTQIAVLEDDVLVEHYVTQTQATSFAGNVYLGRVQNVLPSMEAAFVDIGKGRNAVLYAGEVNWDAAGLSGKSRSIETALKSGDKVLVQVTKDPIGHKGARLTQQINLPGRFLVYVPGGSMTGISRKLPDKERTRLKDILKKIVPDDAGVIIRTAAEGASEEELTRDVARLQAQWEVIQTKAASTSNAPTLLYGEPDLAIRVIRDVFNEDFKRLVVSGDDAWDTVEAYVAHVSPELSQRLQRYAGTGDVFRDLRIDEQLMKALDRKVWLPSGGSLVIDRTEAMTVVDVNTGKFVGSGGNLEQTVTRNNIEAAEEIVRQLRLRDIGGIIVIDFIDMVLESNRDLVLRRLTECLGRDRTKHQVAEVTSLGLVQMTRKRVGQGLLEVFSEPCEHCRGRGVLVHLDPVEDKKRSGGNGGGSAGGSSSGGSSSGSNGGGRNRDRGDSGGNGRGDQPRRDAAEPAAADTAEAPVSDESGADSGAGTVEVAEQPTGEGRSGRRSRGRRGRGQSGEARAAEDAAVLAGAQDDEPDTEPDMEPDTEPDVVGDVLLAGETVAEVAGSAEEPAAAPDEPAVAELVAVEAPVEEPTPDTVLAAEIAGTPGDPTAELPVAEQLPVAEEPPVAEVQLEPAVVVAPQSVAEPVAEDAPPVARPRRRRAASRPAGPPA